MPDVKDINEIVTLELSEEEQKQLESTVKSLKAAEQAVEANELIISQIQNLQTQLNSERNAFAAVYFRILSNHKLTEDECFPSPDKKSINVRINKVNS